MLIITQNKNNITWKKYKRGFTHMTKKIAYLYLKDFKTMSRYTNDFTIVEIYSDKYESTKEKSLEPHPVIRCEYLENGKKNHRNVHIDLERFRNWIKSRRENIIDGILM